jgi:hypothetical protein
METNESRVETACRSGTLSELVEEYLAACDMPCEVDAKRSSKRSMRRFPNLAGFCRYFRIGGSEYNALAAKYPLEFEYLSAVLEDEALNSGTKKISASVLNLYLKSRFGYGGEDKHDDDGILSVVCEHSDGE